MITLILIVSAIILVIITIRFLNGHNEKGSTSMVVFTETHSHGVVKYSEYYSVDICPSCKHILNHDKARYDSRCCYLCGYSDDDHLFDCERLTVRDKYINGKYIETIAST